MTTEASSLEVSSPICQAEIKMDSEDRGAEETIEERLRGARNKKRSSESGSSSPGKTLTRDSGVKKEKKEAEKFERTHQNEAIMIESDEFDKMREEEQEEEDEEAEAEDEDEEHEDKEKEKDKAEFEFEFESEVEAEAEEKKDSVMGSNEEALNIALNDDQKQDRQKVSLSITLRHSQAN